MALVTLNLYCSPQDIYDWMGHDSTQLALDDRRQATGQQVVVTTAAALGATALSVQPLQYPLLAGSVLEFDGGGNTAVAEATLTATAPVGAVSLAVVALLAPLSPQANAFDNGSTLAIANRLIKGCQYGTSQVKLYCCSRYDDSQLQTSWEANRWATVLGSRWVAKRLRRSCPEGLQEDYDEAIRELLLVKSSGLNIPDIGTRTSGWPWFSNVTVDPTYDYQRIRVEPQISEGTPTQFPQHIDWNSALVLEF